MYALIIEINKKALEENYNINYSDIREKLDQSLFKHGFEKITDSFYLGSDITDAASSLMTVQILAKNNKWFPRSIKTIKMIKIDEFSDIFSVLQWF